jgi:DUF4097 and DUF4098 domain-containing protein YvlB
MKTSKKIALIVAAVLLGCGVVLALAGFAVLSFDLSKLKAEPLIENTHIIRSEFDDIFVEVSTANVSIRLSGENPSNDCRVVCKERKEVYHTAEVKDGVLQVRVVDNRKWYDHINIFDEEMTVTVYLPCNTEYSTLEIHTDTGDISVPMMALKYTKAIFKSNTGDVFTGTHATQILEARTDTGDIYVNGATGGAFAFVSNTGDIKVQVSNSLTTGAQMSVITDTGDVDLSLMNGYRMLIQTETGDIKMKKVSVDENSYIFSDSGDITLEDFESQMISIVTSTGDVELHAADADQIELTTSTGDVQGTLRSPKVFDIETSTGDVRVPPNGTDCGTCKITTDTGDIDIQIQ